MRSFVKFVAHTYGNDGQLKSATPGTGSSLPSESYSYDAAGNRTSTTLGTGTSTDSTGTDNRVTNDGTYTYQYDADGNRTKRTSIATGAYDVYTWDYRDRLTDVTSSTAGGTETQHVHYTYDVFNRMIGEQVDSNGDGTYDTTQRYVYDGNNVVLTLDGSGNVISRTLYGPQANQVLATENAR